MHVPYTDGGKLQHASASAAGDVRARSDSERYAAHRPGIFPSRPFHIPRSDSSHRNVLPRLCRGGRAAASGRSSFHSEIGARRLQGVVHFSSVSSGHQWFLLTSCLR